MFSKSHRHRHEKKETLKFAFHQCFTKDDARGVLLTCRSSFLCTKTRQTVTLWIQAVNWTYIRHLEYVVGRDKLNFLRDTSEIAITHLCLCLALDNSSIAVNVLKIILKVFENYSRKICDGTSFFMQIYMIYKYFIANFLKTFSDQLSFWTPTNRCFCF